LEVPPLGYGRIYKIISGQNPKKKQYEVIIRNFPACTYLNFVTMMSNLLGWQGKWVPCKHMYYAACHVLWAIWKFHSFSNLELWWNLLLVGSRSNFGVGRSISVHDDAMCLAFKLELASDVSSLVL